MVHLVALITDREIASELEAAAEAAGHDVDVCRGEADSQMRADGAQLIAGLLP